MPQEIHTSSVACYPSHQWEGIHNHRFVRTLRIRQALGLDYPTAASTSPSRDITHRTAGPLERVFMHFGGPPGPWRQARAKDYPAGQSLAPETRRT
jgi:hypothetical protein